MSPEARSELFDAIVRAPDRDRIAGARPVVSWREDDEPDFLAAVERFARRRVELARRGRWHGAIAVLDPACEGREPELELDDARGLARRWHDARPILLRSAALGGLGALRQELRGAMALFEDLRADGALARWLRGRAARLPGGFELSPRRAPLADPERDLERVVVTWRDPERPQRAVQDLWLKSARLSTHEGDASLRLRASFGKEPDDDASPDERRHRLVGALADALMPCAEAVAPHTDLARAVERVAAEPVYFTQHIGYWNAPDGGALFHHDAFAEHEDTGQVAVCYVQLVGSTAWLALSTADLAARVRELAETLTEAGLPWLREELWPRGEDFAAFLALAADDARLTRELGLPGCGALGPLVNRGPEVTGLLADGGHALVLEPGDALLLPNHGRARTALHSVFCASEQPTYGLSVAVRTERTLPPPQQRDPRRADGSRATARGRGGRGGRGERRRRGGGAGGGGGRRRRRKR